MLTLNLIATVSVICLGLLQFGYHMLELNSPEAIMSCRSSKPGKYPFDDSFFGRHGFNECIPMTTGQIGLVTLIFSIGGLIGSLYIGTFADKLGRRKSSLLYCAIYFVGSSLSGLATNVYALIFGRFISGLGAGAALVIVPIFINEIAPLDSKGLLGSMNQVSVNVGILFTQLLALSWSNNSDWRLLLFMGSFLALINGVLIWIYTDELPVWLFDNYRKEEALVSLHKLRGGDYQKCRDEVNSWGVGESNGLLDEESQTTQKIGLETYIKLSEYNNSKLVASGVLILQQFCGINSIIFYGVSVLISIFPNSSIFINCLISLTNVVVTFGAANFVDKLGRKPLLLTSVSVMGISTVLIGLGITTASAISSIIGIFTYIAFFAIGLGPIPFLLISEVTQLNAKASAQSWGITMNWLATFVVGFLFPILKSTWIGGGVYFIFTFMCAFTFWFISHYVPETKGRATYELVWR